MKNFTLCLNIIVKNESECIINTLTNLCSKIDFDYWVICDTGSTDNTKELIKDFFEKKQIKGELYEDEWLDFGHNRTLALQNAYNKTDYLLIFDADDEIVGDIIFPENICQYDSYYLHFGCFVKYDRVILINNRKKWIFKGVLHEYIECLEPNSISHLKGDYYLVSGKHGNRSKDKDKYSKDALILEKAYYKAFDKKDTIYTRYSFYCANSYKDANDIPNAIKWYKNTLTLDNWNQERYISCLRLYELYEKQQNIEQGIYYLIESYQHDKTRVECIYHLIKHYCIKKNNELAYSFYTLIQDYYENSYLNDKFANKLFVNESDYSFYLPYYMIIVCERLKKYDVGLKMYEIIFEKKNMNIGEWWINNLVFNLQFFIDKNKEATFVDKWNQYLSFINKKYNLDKNLINKYEMINVSKFLQVYNSNEHVESHDDSFMVVAILAKDKEVMLPFYLKCIYNQTYNKQFIHLYIRTNDNKDNTEEILKDFIEKHGKEYASVYFDNTSVSENLKKYSVRDWNAFRFKILAKIRQDSIEYALKLNAHYFVADCDNFIIPTTIESLMKNNHLGVIAPMLRTGFNETNKNNVKFTYNNINYSNYNYEVTENGYYKLNNYYYNILNNNVTGLSRVCCVHCAYFIAFPFLSSVNYIDDSSRYEYIIFSEMLRKNGIPQYVDNTSKYGYLTFAEEKDDFEREYECCKSLYTFEN